MALTKKRSHSAGIGYSMKDSAEIVESLVEIIKQSLEDGKVLPKIRVLYPSNPIITEGDELCKKNGL